MDLRRSARSWLALSAVAVAALAFAACGNDADNGNDNDAPPPGPQEITVLMLDNYFDPDDITVAVGQDITFIAVNDGEAVHNMIVRSADVEGQDFASDFLVNPGEESTFSANFSAPGEYEFYCSFHLPGMVGTITVE
jgi:plastocyanin